MAAQANQAQIDALNGQIADLVTLVNQLQNQINAGPAAGDPPPPPPVVPPAVFARDPAQVNQVNLLNYNDRKDTDIYKNGSAALPGDAFDGTNLTIWLGKVESRATSLGMLPILTIGGHLMTKRYADMTQEQVRLAAITYQNARGRTAQNAAILYNFLSASITDEVLAKVNTEPGRYVLPIGVAPNIEMVNDGICFLKAIIDYSITNSRSSASAARTALSSLDVYIASLPDSDIKKANLYIKGKLNELAACGETTTDLIDNLFKGYFKAKDIAFTQWLQRIKDDWTDRREQINPNGLAFMQRVENYYKDRLNSGEWMKLSEDQATILALKTQLQNVTKDKKDKKDKKGKKGKGGKGGKDKENKEPYEKPAWKKKAPKDGEKQQKEVDGKTYHWCIHHKEWTMHSSSECRKKSETKEKDDKKKSKKSEKKSKVENLTLKVLQTIAEHVDQGAGTDSESCCSP